MTTATQRVAEFVANLDIEQIPEPVLEKAKVTVLHDLGVALAGHALAAPAFELAHDLGRCDSGARVPVTGVQVTVEQAVLATAALMHARTQDDTQMSALTHLGCTTLPAALALSDRDDRSGRDFLAAVIAGYEATSAIAAEHAGLSTARGFRASSIYGPFGAAAASAWLLGLDATQTTNALGIAAGFGGGTNQTWVAGTQEWQFQVGNASRNGMIAALLASRGVTGAPDALEGAAGHYRSFAGTTDGAERIAIELGSRWRILDVTYKPYPICAVNQAPVTVIGELVDEHDIQENEVESITLRLTPGEATYPGVNEHGPFTDVGGSLMSAPYCLAVAVRKRAVSLADLSEYWDESLMELVRRIEVVADPDLPSNSCRLLVRTPRGDFSKEFISTRETFNWDRVETAGRLTGIVDDMPFAKDRLDQFVEVVLNLDNRSVRDLVAATIV